MTYHNMTETSFSFRGWWRVLDVVGFEKRIGFGVRSEGHLYSSDSQTVQTLTNIQNQFKLQIYRLHCKQPVTLMEQIQVMVEYAAAVVTVNTMLTTWC
jgi:hypothetical protein